MSVEVTREHRLSLVNALASLPLYQLSTAGMELFHTNMLYWLATERPDESLPVWNALGLPAARSYEYDPFIRREWRHIDLAVSPGLGQRSLVIENKIGAIPTSAQLVRYWSGLQGTRLPFGLDATECVLLTLTPPTFALPEPWRSVTYRDLQPALQETATVMPESDVGMVSAYAVMVGRLDEVATVYDPLVHLDAQIALSSDERNRLAESRLLSLVEKVRAARFAELATRLLADSLGRVGTVGSGFRNGSAMNEWFVEGPDGRQFGWQIERGQFRLVVITGEHDPRSREERESLVRDLYESYFDFTPPAPLVDTLTRYTGKKEWLSYEPNFVYRYASLAPDTTWHELLALVEWFSTRARAFATGAHE